MVDTFKKILQFSIAIRCLYPLKTFSMSSVIFDRIMNFKFINVQNTY